jgi:hypothetical protein
VGEWVGGRERDAERRFILSFVRRHTSEVARILTFFPESRAAGGKQTSPDTFSTYCLFNLPWVVSRPIDHPPTLLFSETLWVRIRSLGLGVQHGCSDLLPGCAPSVSGTTLFSLFFGIDFLSSIFFLSYRGGSTSCPLHCALLYYYYSRPHCFSMASGKLCFPIPSPEDVMVVGWRPLENKIFQSTALLTFEFYEKSSTYPYSLRCTQFPPTSVPFILCLIAAAKPVSHGLATSLPFDPYLFAASIYGTARPPFASLPKRRAFLQTRKARVGLGIVNLKWTLSTL